MLMIEIFGEHCKLFIRGLKLTRSLNELESYLKEYLDNPALDIDKRDFLRKKLLYKLDGRVSERMLDYLI